MMMFYKKVEKDAKRASRVRRPLATNSPDRVELANLSVGDAMNGTVISITDFGAYVDVRSECDALLHVSQITRKEFVEHPRQVLSPGDEIDVTVSRLSPELKKMQVTMLSEKERQIEAKVEGDVGERIPLEDLSINDELWGEIKRVTAYGAYVELGTAAQGWLHFMDHPEFGNVPGATPDEFMKIGDRIRCWVANVDTDLNRIKLTANRPEDLPGPRRETIKRADFTN
jgi:small subunit ribosomal protein S1